MQYGNWDQNNTARAPEIVHGLLAGTWGFVDAKQYLRKGACPNCGKKELYVRKEQPWRIACSRESKCGATFTAKELLPNLFENWVKRFPPTQANPKATADAYLMEDRGFDLSMISAWYNQENYRLKTGEAVPTARFYFDSEKTRYWERLIGKTKADGQKANIGGKRKKNGSLYQGDAWTPSGQTLEQGDTVYITEGIFHAIALYHYNKKAAASISCNNFPRNLIEAHKNKGINWVLAMDGDKAGQRYMKKHYKTLKEMGQNVSVCLLPDGKKDWDDLHQLKKINDDFIESCIYAGNLFIASSITEKAWLIYCKNKRRKIVTDFRGGTYSIEIEKDFEEDLKDNNLMIDSEDAFDLFKINCSVDLICNVSPTFLYLEKDELLQEQQYVFNIKYKNGTPSKIIGLEGNHLTSGDSFNKALLNSTNGGRYFGNGNNFSTLVKRWLDGRMLEVKSVPFIGYDKNAEAWIFHDHAFQNGKKIKLNEHGYFELNKLGMKTSLGGLNIKTDGEFKSDWLPDYIKAFSYQGLAVLAFWLGTLFAQQIREKHKTFPFLEFTGEPGAGKSTVLEFCWKLVGRDEYEGFDIAKSTPAGRRRAFNQVSNLPIVIIESDRDKGDNDKKPQQFDFDECKPFYNGRATGTLGIATRSNDVDEQLFQASLLISQNAEVDGSEALLQRIVHCHVDKKHHGQGTKEIARWFERQRSEDVAGFLSTALKKEKNILSTYFKAFKQFEVDFAKELKNERIIKNHAQIAACAKALQVVFPNLNDDTVKSFVSYLCTRAEAREERIRADHPIVEKFWEIFHYINGDKQDQSGIDLSEEKDQIALNLNHFRAQSISWGQEVLDISLLKKLLPYSKKHKLLNRSKIVWLKKEKKTARCWVFQK